MQNSTLINLINGALRNQDNIIRSQAEAQLVDFRNSNTSMFFIQNS